MKFFLGLFALLPVLGQSSITGPALVTLEDGGTDCNGRARVVDIYVDVSGLSGIGGEAGLNGFALAFDLNRANVVASAYSGVEPEMGWYFRSTSKPEINLINTVRVVGSVADPSAPNQNYHVATLWLSGLQGDVTLTFNATLSSLGSRRVLGDGPGPIEITPPLPLTVTIPADFLLDLIEGADLWHRFSVAYDLAEPSGDIDVLDLVKMLNCDSR